MKTKHAKSPCCGEKIIRYGQRRRQCLKCRHTWRIRSKKRGRKERRGDKSALIKFLNHKTATLSALAESRNMPKSTLQERVSKLLDRFLARTPWPRYPQNVRLILVADARVKYVEGGWFTGYFFFVRPVGETEAIILPPVWFPGTETSTRWKEAFKSLPSELLSQIVALVCDGHTGLVWEARWRGWLLQRCHAHLIMRIQSRRSRWYSSQHQTEGEEIYSLVKRVLREPDEQKLVSTLSRLEEIGWDTHSRDLKNILRGFVNNYRDWRTYLAHPNLNLPTTNNTAESFSGCVHELVHRARGFRTRLKLQKWVAAIIKNRKTIKCNGKNQPN